MNKILSIRPTLQLHSLFTHIKAFQPSANRSEIINAGIATALNHTVDWISISSTRIPLLSTESSSLPNFIQLRVNLEDYQIISQQIHNQFHLEKMPAASYVIKLVLINYLLFLQEMDTPSLQITNNNRNTTTSEFLTPEEFNSLASVESKLDYIYNLLYNTQASLPKRPDKQ